MNRLIYLGIADKRLADVVGKLAEKHYCEIKIANSSITVSYTKHISDCIFDGWYSVELRISNDLSTNTKNTYITIKDSDNKHVFTEYCRLSSLEALEEIVTRRIVESIERRIEVLEYMLKLLKEK